MLLWCIYFKFVAGFYNQDDKEMLSSNNINDSLPYNFDLDNVLRILGNGDVETFLNPDNINNIQIAAENTPGDDISQFILNSIDNLQEESNGVLPLSNISGDYNSYCEDFMTQFNENINLFINEQTNEDLCGFRNLQSSNCDESNIPTCTNKMENTNDCDAENDFDNLDILNRAYKSVFEENEIGKIMIQSEKSNIKCENKRLKFFHSCYEFPGLQNNSCNSNSIDNLEAQNFTNKVFKEHSDNLSLIQSSACIKTIIQKLRKAIYNINRPKTFPAGFYNSKIHSETLYLSLCSDLNELTDMTEYVKNLNKILIEKRIFIENSPNNRNILEDLHRLALSIRKTVRFYEKSICRNILTLSTETLFKYNEILKNMIEDNKNEIKSLKINGIGRILEIKNIENKLVCKSKVREIKFLYQEKNISNINTFKIFIEKRFYPAYSFSVFEESIFLCVCSPQQYLKIFIIDLKTRKYQEIDTYGYIEKKQYIKYQCFGYGSKNTIIRSSSTGKLFLLKSSLKKPSESIADARNSFEMLVIDRQYKMFACIKVDSMVSLNNSVQPAIVDFLVLNDSVYALDIIRRCIKIFDESLVLLKIISIPENLTEAEAIHLAVSNKHVLLGAGKIIYYINHNDQCAEFKKLEFDNRLLNIACYAEEYIVARFDNGCYSFKIEENLSDIKYTHLPSLDQLKGLSLINFTIKDNFVYSMCEITGQIYRINLTLNSTNQFIQ